MNYIIQNKFHTQFENLDEFYFTLRKLKEFKTQKGIVMQPEEATHKCSTMNQPREK